MDVLEELVDDQINREYVERRVEDWRARIADLYVNVMNWLPTGWTAREDGTVPMHEELMQRFGVSETRLPILRLAGSDNRQGWMEPRGLWIIGANGRVDLILPPRHYLIVNREDSFEPPLWRLTPLDDRRTQQAFDQTLLQKILLA